MEEVKEPWERIDLSNETIRRMYRDWGLNCVQKRLFKTAEGYYDQSLDLNGEDAEVLCYRSKVKRFVGQAANALKDGRAAARVDNYNATVNLEICDALYETNDLENFKIELHDNTRKFRGNKKTPFQQRIVVVDENFNDTIGESLSPFILENGKHFSVVLESEYRRKHPDSRPLWKQLREQDKCDVLSIQDKQEALLSPLEIARRERASNVLHQIYFNKTWADVQFVKKMRENTDLLLPQSNLSTPLLQDLTQDGYNTIKKFAKMLQTRSPMYNELGRRCPSRKLCQKHREDTLFRVQYQTRRNMVSILRNVRELRAKGHTEKLSTFVEGVMGDYVVLKTHRVMPWKLEFVVEVYNILALAYIDPYLASRTLTQKQSRDRLLQLLRMRNEKPRGPVMFVFGDRSTFQEPEAVDKKYVAYKKFVARLEKRLLFAKYEIERAYLYHEIARSHLKQSRYDECCSVARKAIEEAKRWGSNVWEFLSYLLILKAHAALSKIESFQDVLDNVVHVVRRLKCPELHVFLDQCLLLNGDQLAAKKLTQSQSVIRVKGSRRGSFASQVSRATSGDTDVNSTLQQSVSYVSK